MVVDILIILAGIFTFAGGLMDWNWFMTNRRARLFVGLFGRRGARIVYMGLGVFLMIMGIVSIAS